MNYCPKCGMELSEGTLFCPKCGNYIGTNVVQTPTNNDLSNTANDYPKKKTSGASKASLVLGILAIIFALISVVCALGLSSYYSQSINNIYSRYTTNISAMKMGAYIMFLPLPSILSIIGFFLGIGSSTKDGCKIAGLILNLLSIILCVIVGILIYNI